MNITDVRVYHNENSKILANASITFDGKLVIRGIKVLMKNDGSAKFISMPSYRKQDETYSDYVFSLDAHLRNEIQDKILQKYNQTLPQDTATREYQGPYTAPIDVPSEEAINRINKGVPSIDVSESDLPF